MKETGASFVTIKKDLEVLGKGKKTRARDKAKGRKQVKVKRAKKVTKGPKRIQQEKPVEAQEGEKG